MAHDGSSRLNEFASFTDDSESDLSVAGKLSLSLQGNLKLLAAGGLAATTDILSPNGAAQSFDFLTAGTVDAVSSVGHVDALTVDLSVAKGGASLTNVTADFGSMSALDVLNAPTITGTLQTMADYLRVGFWTDRGQTSHQFNLGSSGNWANSGTLYYNVAGFSSNLSTDYGTEGSDSNGLTAARQTMVREALKLYSAVLGINFVETTSTDTNVVDFFFKDNVAGTAYEAERTDSGTGGNVHYTVINVDVNWYSGLSNIGGVNAYTFQTFIHEIAHGLGLGHQGLYNAGSGSPTYANSATFINDSWQQTMMSYWGQTENTEYSDDSYAQLVTPMAVDWIALNAIYSGQGYGTANAFTGNTVYGVGTNISTATSVAFANLASYASTNAFTIVDGSGIDTIDFSNYNANQIIDLYISTASQTHAWLSSVGGLTKNMTIAVGVVIENATTGGGNDTIWGNTASNILTANGGNDYVYDGYGGNDTEYGGSGDDTLQAYGGNAYQDGGTGNDFLYSGTANDVGYGGDGNDYISSSDGNDYLAGNAGTDTLYGGGGDDTVWGYDNSGINNADLLYAGDGNDWVYVGTGAETADGGLGTDAVILTSSNSYNFNMATGVTNQTGEVFTGFEIVYMTSGDDTVVGGTGNTTIYGGTGNDSLSGGEGGGGVDYLYGGTGDDTMDGGGYVDNAYGGDGNDLFTAIGGWYVDNVDGGNGIDTLDLSGNTSDSFNVDLGAGTYSYINLGGSYTVTTVENVVGSVLNDSITGSTDDNVLYGGLGDDTINDGAGNDSVYGGDGNDLIQAGDSSFVGDTWFGGAGTDTLSFAAFSWGTPFSPVVFDFGAGTATYNGFVENFSGFEVFQGSQGDETIISDAQGHSFYGNDGNDSMVSALGDEQMFGGNGIDTIDHRVWAFDYTFDMGTGLTQYTNELYQGFEVAYMGAGNDSVTGTTGDETIYGGDGNDTLNDGAGNDSVYGGEGNDLLIAGDSSFLGDSWFGGNGTDTLSYAAYSWGTPFSPVVFDFIVGTASYNGFVETISGFEIFQGSQGDETIISDGLSHSFYGNDGNDSMVAGSGLQFMYGGNGTDTLDMTANDSNRTFTMWTGLTNLSGESYQGFEVVYMGDGNDMVIGSAGDNTIYGGLGNDTIKGLGSSVGDFVYGGDGNDNIVASAGAATLDGGNGIDTINNFAIGTNVVFDMSTGATNIAGHTYLNFEVAIMGAGNDLITGSGNNDTIYANAGNDSMYGGGGVDDLYGYAGNDYFRYVTGAGYDNMYGGTGVDTVAFDPFFGDNLTIDLLLGTYNAGGPVFAIVGVENVTTTTGKDSISGNNDNNYIDSGDGNDTIFGAAGNDGVYGGNGNDFVRGGAGSDNIGGGAGDDLMGGDDGNDSMFGAAGNDAMYGGNGNDVLYGGLGNDTVMGNAGNDVFVFTGTVLGTDRIMDFTEPGITDKIDFTALIGIAGFNDLVTNHLTTVAGNAVITLGASTITIIGVLGSALLADDFVF